MARLPRFVIPGQPQHDQATIRVTGGVDDLKLVADRVCIDRRNEGGSHHVFLFPAGING